MVVNPPLVHQIRESSATYAKIPFEISIILPWRNVLIERCTSPRVFFQADSLEVDEVPQQQQHERSNITSIPQLQAQCFALLLSSVF